jgi:hypothetical protein
MKKVLLAAAAAALVAGAVPSPAGAGGTYYLLSVDILGTDGSVALHKQLKCPRYDDCIDKFPFELQGKKQTIYVKARVQDEHHIYVIAHVDIGPGGDETTATKPFEAGSEWMMELHKLVTVPRDSSKPRLKWDKSTTEQRWQTVLKLHMKLES